MSAPRTRAAADHADVEAELAEARQATPPTVVYADDPAKVTVRGPYLRIDARTGGIRRAYTVNYYDPPHSERAEDRRKEMRDTEAKARARAKEIVSDIANAGRTDAAPRRRETLDALLDAHLVPTNHRKGRRDGRSTGWGSPRTRENHLTLANWMRPLIGAVRCEDLATPLSGRDDALNGLLPFDAVLRSMDAAGLAASTRRNHYRNMQGLVTYGRGAGFIPPHIDPLDGVVQPEVSRRRDVPERWVDPEDIPTREHTDVLAEVYADWGQHSRRWDPDYCRRWAAMPLVVAHTGLRLGEMLGLRACDVTLDETNPAVTIDWQIDRHGQRVRPKHGSRRRARYPLWLQPILAELVALAVADGGPNALLWPSLFDRTKPVRYDAFTTSYFHPQAAEAHARLAAAGKRGWEYEDRPQEEAPGVPRLRADGTPVVRREFIHTMVSLRHYYATVALAPSEQGGWGAAVHSVAKWMGHSSPTVTWDMYAAELDTALAHHLEATRVDPMAAPVQQSPR